MKKTLCFVLVALLSAFFLSACSAFEREYVTVKDYVPSMQKQSNGDGSINVSSFSDLKQALLNMAYNGITEGTIVFDASYSGDTTEDMGSACWQVRTQDALCAYCVENMSYELNKIVTINEATVYISYSDVSEAAGDITHLAFTSGIDEILSKAFHSGTKKLAVLIGRSTYSAEDMAAAVIRAYRENPAIIPMEPTASVILYSGNASQKLYEININYGMSREELEQRRSQIERLDPFPEINANEADETMLAYAAADYLRENCTLSEADTENTAYSALVERSANCEGIAFAYIELCRRLNIDCQIVYGQKDWHEHCWNIVQIDGKYYHIDLSAVIEQRSDSELFRNDEQVWGKYRWDVSSYPKCNGEALSRNPQDEGKAAQEEENNSQNKDISA